MFASLNLNEIDNGQKVTQRKKRRMIDRCLIRSNNYFPTIMPITTKYRILDDVT